MRLLLYSLLIAFNSINVCTNGAAIAMASSATEHSLVANVTEGTVLHLWLRSNLDGQEASILAKKLSSGSNATAFVIASSKERNTSWYEFVEVATLEYAGQLELSWSTSVTNVSLIYVYEPEKVLNDGIDILYKSQMAALPSDLTSFHFAPPVGWTNDPNGFSRSADGLYHLFYQFNPWWKMWWAMHWGHAVSRDLIHWTHLPVFLHPTRDQMSGGIFSGSAKPVGADGLRIYYADHTDGRTPLELQRSVLTKDLIRPIGPKVTAIPDRPSQIASITTQDFRDPNVFTGPGNSQMMLLGSKLANQTAGVILLYKHNPNKGDEPMGWEFQSILHNDTRWAINAAECPGLLPLGNVQAKDTPWALIYGAQNSEDSNGRGFLSPIILGTFDGKQFVPKSEKLIDFVSGSYGYQGFHDRISGQSFLIGWLANWPDRDPNVDFPTTMTVPRVLKLSSDNQTVLLSPHPGLLSLREKQLGSAAFKNFQPVFLPNGTADIEVELNNKNVNISLNLNHSVLGKNAIKIMVSPNGLEMQLSWKSSSKFKFNAPGVFPSNLSVLIDQRSVEVFADDGIAVGTTRIPSDGHVQSVQFSGNLAAVKSAQIWSVKSIH